MSGGCPELNVTSALNGEWKITAFLFGNKSTYMVHLYYEFLASVSLITGSKLEYDLLVSA